MRELAAYEAVDDSEYNENVILSEPPEPIVDLIQKDVFNVVPVGSKAFKQLPVVDQARIYLNQNVGKSRKHYLDYKNVPETKKKL